MGSIPTLPINSILLFFLVISTATATVPKAFNILDFGAVPNGKSDCSKAFLNAWAQACVWEGNAAIVIPAGSFLTGPMTFKGPCKGQMVFQVTGTVIASEDLNVYPRGNWVVFLYLQRLKVTGKGVFDGRGASAWPHNLCRRNSKCKVLPTSIQFSYVNDSVVEGITSLNSKMFHIMIYKCNKIKLQYVTVKAPENSPNTDGIHIGLSTNVDVFHSNIGTGDDCVSLGHTNTGISVTDVFCGPGHGISIGSLGKDQTEKDVTNVYVKNCTLTKTMNGVRIKTWQQSSVLEARNLTFDDITMNDVGNPIIIDQEYCPLGNCAGKTPSLVKISDIKFKNIRGTSSTPVAVNLKCSKAVPCKGVQLSNIHLKYGGLGQQATAACANVVGACHGDVVPPSCI